MLREKLKKLFPDMTDEYLRTNVILQDDLDDRGAYIYKWDDPGPQPTEAELLAVVLP